MANLNGKISEEVVFDITLEWLVDKCHKNAKEKGFWDKKRRVAELLMLIVSELAEAMEADRHGDKDNFNEEIADTLIRLCDLCGGLKIDIVKVTLDKMRKNAKRPRLHGKRY